MPILMLCSRSASRLLASLGGPDVWVTRGVGDTVERLRPAADNMTSETIDTRFQHLFTWKVDGRKAHRHKVLRATKFIRLGQELIEIIAVGLLLPLKLTC